MASSVNQLLQDWVTRQVPESERLWLEQKLDQVRGGQTDRQVFVTVSTTARNISRDVLELSKEDLAAASAARDSWNPRGWTADQAARVLLLLESTDDPQALHNRLDMLFRTADVGELVALYQALPIYPEQSLYVSRAAEGIRTNMKSVFEAVAHDNPYPREFLDEGAFNQMVLKALFVESKLDPIQGLDERANPTLMKMLCDYAHERWAAGRTVSPELWRCVGPFADDSALGDLQRVLDSDDTAERQAATLALSACPSKKASDMLTNSPYAKAVVDGSLTWSQFG